MAEWIEIVIHSGAAQADELAALIAGEVEAASAGTQIRSGDVVFWAPLDQSEHVLADTKNAVAKLASLGFPIDPSRVSLRPAAPESEWQNAWKRYFHVTRLTRQIVIVPSWETYQPAGDDIVIDLDPGQAFGTGAHASTRLILTELQALADAGRRISRFFDLGTGSGILAIAAAKLWPEATGLAVDLDPLAVGAAAENCERNRVSAQVACADTPLADVAERFDLVLANIQASVLYALKDGLAARVAPGGVLLLSGLLTNQADGVAQAYEQAGLRIERIQPFIATEGSAHASGGSDWSSVLLARAPA